jgi:multicomponent Na+:H+ antiporter subunit E
MSVLLLNLALALVWALVTGNFEPGNLIVGFLLGYAVLWGAQRVIGASAYFQKVPQVMRFALFFSWELLLANVRVAGNVLLPYAHLQPRIVGVPLEAHTHTEVVLLSYLIALTPGTLVLDVSNDRRVIYIHAMYAADHAAVQRSIKDGLERPLLRLLRGKES